MTFGDFVTKYDLKSGVGTNSSDKGECVGIYNLYTREVWGLEGYPIQDVSYAKDLLEGKNTRPDVLKIIYNNPSDPKQLPAVGDAVVFTGAFAGSGGMGHVGMVVKVTATELNIYDQYQGAHCTIRKRGNEWKSVKGWIHFEAPKPVTPPVDPTVALKARIAELEKLNTTKDGVIAAQKKEIETLKAQLGELTKWQTLRALVRELFGIK